MRGIGFGATSNSEIIEMKIGIVINTNDPETVWNAFRFANTSLLENHEVKVFLLGRGVEIEQIKDEKFNVTTQTARLLQAGGQILACGTCLKMRNMKELTICPISSMVDLLKIVQESDRVLTFS